MAGLGQVKQKKKKKAALFLPTVSVQLSSVNTDCTLTRSLSWDLGVTEVKSGSLPCLALWQRLSWGPAESCSVWNRNPAPWPEFSLATCSFHPGSMLSCH